jgi:hypothetical protein
MRGLIACPGISGGCDHVLGHRVRVGHYLRVRVPSYDGALTQQVVKGLTLELGDQYNRLHSLAALTAWYLRYP